MSKKTLYIILLVTVLMSCNNDMEEINPKTISKLKVQDGKFSNAQNVDFFPWGFNYTNAENVGLIEDNRVKTIT